MTDRDLLHLARDVLSHEEFRVWVAKHYGHHGRHRGAALLNITPDQYRTRLTRAESKITAALEQEPA